MSKMFNKALIATAVLAASAGLAYANGGTYVPEAVVAGPTHNCYVGVAVSRDFAQFNFDTDESFTFAPDEDGFDSIGVRSVRSADLGHDGWGGQLNIGYGGTFQDHYWLAAEIFGSISSAKADFSEAVVGQRGDDIAAVGFNGSVKLRYLYGIALVPGVKVSDSSMLYGRIGWVRGKFRANVDLGAATADVNGNVTVLSGSFEQDHSSNGLQLGIGLETMVTNNVSLKVEYDWNRFGNTFGENHPTVNQALVGVSYHFMSA